jgi:hypothetical protein
MARPVDVLLALTASFAATQAWNHCVLAALCMPEDKISWTIVSLAGFELEILLFRTVIILF